MMSLFHGSHVKVEKPRVNAGRKIWILVEVFMLPISKLKQRDGVLSLVAGIMTMVKALSMYMNLTMRL